MILAEIYLACFPYVLIVFLVLSMLLTARQLVVSFRSYVEHGKFDDADPFELENTHPIAIFAQAVVFLGTAVMCAGVWPITIAYVCFVGAAKLAHRRNKKRSEFLSKLAGKEKNWND